MPVTDFTAAVANCQSSVMAYFAAAVPVVLGLFAVILGVRLLIGVFKWLADALRS